MALKDCLERALNARLITPKQAEKISKLAEGAEVDEKRILESFIQDVQEAKRRVHLQTVATKRNLSDVANHPHGVGRGVLALLVRDIEGKAPYSNVDYRRKAILSQLYGQMAEAMERYRTKNLGFSQDAKGIKSMVKELFGESSGDSDAARFGQMWSEAAETARLRFMVAGGNIPQRQDWGLPHIHDSKRIGAVAFEEWRDYMVPRLDRKRIFNKFGLPMNNVEFTQLIRELYDQFSQQAKITTRDIPRTVPNKVDHRLLTFKDSASWLEYNERFGEPDIYHAMMTHLDHMAGDVALMEILGPNPDAAIRQFTDMATNAGTPYLTMKTIRDSYEVVTGRINQTESEFIAGLGTSVRNWLSSAQLGSAFISSFSDLWTNKLSLAANGIPGVKFIGRIFSQMNPASKEDRIFAVKLGLGAEAWITRALAASRFQEITGHGLSAKISDSVFRATLLSPWTDAGRKAFGMEFLGFIADNTAKKFDELPSLLSESMARYGITANHWEVIRRAPVIERDGARYLRPMDIPELTRTEGKELASIFRSAAEDVEAEAKLRGNRPKTLGKRMSLHRGKAEQATARVAFIQDAANKLQEMLLTEMDFAVPMPDARVRAITTQGQKRGSIVGELARSATLYKQFPITMITTHLYRGARTLDGFQKAKYLAELMVGLTVMGAIAHQSKQIAKGRDAQDMTDPKFWAYAFAQGGGAGIYGDFLFSDVNRFGKGPVMTMLGPVADLVDDSTRLTVGNLQEFLQGEETKFMKEGVQYMKRYTPGSNAWYARLALERLFWDRLLEASDPDAHRSFRRIMQNARKEYGQEYWWRPGALAPERAPDVSAAFPEN
jgi:hypothetical protein